MMKFATLLFLLIFLNACQKEELELSNLNGSPIIALGHGGMGFTSTYPLNTFESFRQCLSLGLDGSEIDVQLTKDNVLVAFHDEKMEDKTNMTGYVHDYTWQELQDAYYTNLPYLDYRIVSLDQVFSSLSNPSDFQFVFDCKLNSGQSNNENYNNDFMDAIIAIVEKYKLKEELYVESTNEQFLAEFQERKPNYLYLISVSPFDFALQRAKALNLAGVSVDNKDITSEQVEIAHQANKKVSVWNVHYQSDNLSAIKKRVDIIQSDSPRSLLRLLKQ